MATTQRSLLIGVFTEHGQADVAIEELQQAGFNSDLLTLSHRRGVGGLKNLFSKLRDKEENIVDDLKRLGLSDEEAQHYQNELDADRIVVTAQADGRQEDARAILERNGAFDIKARP